MKNSKPILKIFCALLASVTMLCSFSGCLDEDTSDDDSKDSKEVNTTFEDPYSFDFGTVTKAEIVVKNYGTIKLDLYPDEAPKTVANFVELAEKGFYDGLIFHRVISGFMIQGGDPTGTGYGADGQTTIEGEFTANNIRNRISHVRGVISMARKGGDNNSATSQFFIMHADNPSSLDGQYAAFGRVTDGMDVVDAIASVSTNSSDRPTEDVVIESITIIK